MLDVAGEYSPAGDDVELFSCTNEPSAMKKRKHKNKRRFSDEQIRSLEMMFESESRLEPRKKLQLARDLGLQPRQVAIWFQNKRARWKSKQLEKEYDALRASYNSLAVQYEAIKKEKQSLISELNRLNELVRKSQEEEQCCRERVGLNNIDRQSDNGDRTAGEPESTNEYYEQRLGLLSGDENMKADQYFGLDEEPSLMTIVEAADSSLTSSEDWGNFETEGLYDNTSSSCQWWEFWS